MGGKTATPNDANRVMNRLSPIPALARAISGVRGAVNVARHLPDTERMLVDRFETVFDRFAQATSAVESLIPLLERQGDTSASLVSLLEANAATTARMLEELIVVRAGIERMHPDITAMSETMESLNDNLSEIRIVAEPLRSASMRVGRFSDRHPIRSRS